MKKILIFMFSLVMIILVGCSNKEVYENNYTFKGENERWEAKYTSEETVTFTENDDKTDTESNSHNRLTVTYKGELSDLSSVKHMEIAYETDLGEGKLVNDYGESEGISSKTFTLTSSSSITDENEVIKVTINLDGEEETLELKSTQ